MALAANLGARCVGVLAIAREHVPVETVGEAEAAVANADADAVCRVRRRLGDRAREGRGSGGACDSHHRGADNVLGVGNDADLGRDQPVGFERCPAEEDGEGRARASGARRL